MTAADARSPADVVVVGGSLGGVVLCESLRGGGFSGTITVVDADHEPHVDRPPLSKSFLAGDGGEDVARLRTQAQLDGLLARWELGTSAVGLDTRSRRMALGDGRELGFEHLVISTGSRARLPPSLGAHNAITLRSIADGRRLRSMLGSTRRLVVIGAGFLGLEVAATASELGITTTVVEALGHPLGRVMPPAIGAALGLVHERAGVQLRCGASVVPYGCEGYVSAVELVDGTRCPADLVVVAVGADPSVDWLEGSTLKLDDGVVCDEHLRAAPGIWAIGDVARWPHRLAGGTLRVEHWTNAVEQARYVARSIVAGAAVEPFSSLPYFWSRQHGTYIQSFGVPDPRDTVHVIEGALESGRFLAALEREGSLSAVVAFDMPKALVHWSRKLTAGTSLDAALGAVGAR